MGGEERFGGLGVWKLRILKVWKLRNRVVKVSWPFCCTQETEELCRKLWNFA